MSETRIQELKNQLKKANETIKQMKRIKKHVSKAIKFTTTKGGDLHWLGRRDINGVLDGGPPEVSLPNVVRILAKYPREANIIKDGGDESTHEMGFWSGVMAAGRLFEEISDPTAMYEKAAGADLQCLEMEKPWAEYTDKEKKEVEDLMIENAWHEFPNLDS